MRHIGLGLALAVLAAGDAGCAHSKTVRLYKGPPPPSGVAELEAPEFIEILRVDGRRVPGLGLAVGRKALVVQAPAGEHRVVARYAEYWPAGEDRDERVVSEPRELVWHARAGARDRLESPRPGTRSEARALARNFLPRIVTDAPPVTAPLSAPETGTVESPLQRAWTEASPEEREALRRRMNAPPAVPR
jgi:hypothetical protein